MNSPLLADRSRFRDGAGREVLPHGVNFVHKDSVELPWRETDFAFARAMGMSTIRLGMVWPYLEPEPGVIREHYVEELRQCLDWAWQHGLTVYLDMHQDCYSYRLNEYGAEAYADALEWQAFADGLPHENPGSVWSDAYLQSPAVKRMFDNFWSNRPAADGMGLQDHYANAWHAVASRLGDHPALAGYDLMNEPNPGSAAEGIMARILARGAIALFFTTGRLVRSLDEIISLWMDADERSTLAAMLDDPSRFRRVMRAGRRRLVRAERTLLAPFYEKVAAAIRTADADRLIMTEPFTGEFMGMRSSLSPPRAAGTQSAYVPHVYDIVVDTDNEDGFNLARTASIAAAHLSDAARRGEPCLIGEWGAFTPRYGDERMGEGHRALFEQHLLGDSYWCYEPYAPFSRADRYARGIWRPVPVAVAGTITRMESTDALPGTGSDERFTLEWVPATDVPEPTIVYVPGRVTGHDARALEPVASYRYGAYYRIDEPPAKPDGRACIEVRFDRSEEVS